MNRIAQSILIVSAVWSSWLGMMAVHEAGHAVAAWATGGTVTRVVLHPTTISRTDIASNPHPLVVVWAGPIVGVTFPILFWFTATRLNLRMAYLARFFAGFCLIANGAYIGVGSLDGVGDAGDMLRLGSPIASLWAFGIVAVALGLFLWHGQGRHFGLGAAAKRIEPKDALFCLAIAIVLIVVCCWFGE